jgi:hypothetical protein
MISNPISLKKFSPIAMDYWQVGGGGYRGCYFVAMD